MANGMENLTGIAKTFWGFVEKEVKKADPKILEKIDKDHDGTVQSKEVISYVFENRDRFGPQLKNVESSFGKLGYDSQATQKLLLDDPKKSADTLVQKGKEFETNAQSLKDEAKRKEEIKAKEAYRLATEIDPTSSVAHREYAKVLYREEKYKEARFHIHEAIKNEKDPQGLIEIVKVVQGSADPSLQDKGPWDFVGLQLVQSKRYADAKALYHAAAVEAASQGKPERSIAFTEQELRADELEKPYERLFTHETSPEADRIFSALRAQGVPSGLIDGSVRSDVVNTPDRKITAEEVFAFVDNHLDDPRVSRALKETGMKPPPWENGNGKTKKEYATPEFEKLGFSQKMAAYHAHEAEKSKNPTAKEAHLIAATRFDGANPAYHRALGDFYSANQDWEKAKGAYQKALSLQSSDTDSAIGLGRIYYLQGDIDKAYAYLSLPDAKAKVGEEYFQLARVKLKADKDKIAALNENKNKDEAKALLKTMTGLATEVLNHPSQDPQQRWQDLKLAKGIFQDANQFNKIAKEDVSFYREITAVNSEIDALAHELRGEPIDPTAPYAPKDLPYSQKLTNAHLLLEIDLERKVDGKDFAGNVKSILSDMDHYTELLDKAPPGAISDKDKAEAYLDLYKGYVRFRESKGPDGELLIPSDIMYWDNDVIHKKMRHLSNQILEIPPYNNSDVRSTINGMFDDITESQNSRYLSFLSADGLSQYAEKVIPIKNQAYEDLQKAYAEPDPKKQRGILLQVMAAYASVGDDKDSYLFRAVETIENSIPQDASPRERLSIHMAMAQALQGGQFTQAGDNLRNEVRNKCRADSMQLISMPAKTEKERVENLLMAQVFYQGDDDKQMTAVVEGMLKTERENLEKFSFVQDVSVTLLGLSLQNPHDRAVAAGLIVQIDQGLFVNEAREAEKDDDNLAKFSKEKIAHLEQWRAAVAEDKDLSIEDRLTAQKMMTQAAMQYQALGQKEQPTLPLITDPGLSQLVDSIEADLGKTIDEWSKTPEAESLFEKVPPDLVEPLKTKVAEDLKGRLHQAVQWNEIGWIGSITSSSLSEFTQYSMAGNALLLKAEKTPGLRGAQLRFEAAQLFTQMGSQDRVTEAMDGVMKYAGSLTDAQDVDKRIQLYKMVALTYNGAKMENKAGDAFDAIAEIGKNSTDPAIQQEGKLAEAMKLMNRGDLDGAKLILADLRSDQAQTLLADITKGQKYARAMKMADIIRSLIEYKISDKDKKKLMLAQLDEVQRLIATGQCETFQEAVDRLAQDSRFPQGVIILTDIPKGPFAVNNSTENLFTNMINASSSLAVSDEEFARTALGAAKYAIIDLDPYDYKNNDFASATAISQMLIHEPGVGGEAETFFKGLGEEQSDRASFLGGGWRKAPIINLFIPTAEYSVEDSITSGVKFVVPFYAGEYLAGRAAIWAGEALFAVEAAPTLIKGVQFGVHAVTLSATVTVTDMALESLFTGKFDHWNITNFRNQFGSLLITTVLLGGISMGMGKVGQMVEDTPWLKVANEEGQMVLRPAAKLGFMGLNYGSRIFGFMGTNYLNEAIGLHEKQNLGFFDRLIDAAITDAQMILSPDVVDGFVGGHLEGMRERSEARFNDYQVKYATEKFQPVLKRLGLDPETKEGRIVMDLLLSRVARGEKIGKIEKSFSEKEAKRYHEIIKENFGVDPQSAEGKKLLSFLINYSHIRGTGVPLRPLSVAEVEREVKQVDRSLDSFLKNSGMKEGPEFKNMKQGLIGLSLSRGFGPETWEGFEKKAPQFKTQLTHLVESVLGDGAVHTPEGDFLMREFFMNSVFGGVLAGQKPEQVLSSLESWAKVMKGEEKTISSYLENLIGKKAAHGPYGRQLMLGMVLKGLETVENPKDFPKTLRDLQADMEGTVADQNQLLKLNHLQGERGSSAMALWVFENGKTSEQLQAMMGPVLEGKVALTIENGRIKEIPIPEEKQAGRQMAILKEFPDFPLGLNDHITFDQIHPDNVRPLMEATAEQVLKKAGYDPKSPEFQERKDVLLAYWEKMEKGDVASETWWLDEARGLQDSLKEGREVKFSGANGEEVSFKHQQGGDQYKDTARWSNDQLKDLAHTMGLGLTDKSLVGTRAMIHGRDPKHPFKLSEAKAALTVLHDAFKAADKRGDFEGVSADNKKLVQITLYQKVMRGEMTLAEAKKLAHEWERGDIKLVPNENKVVTDKGSTTIGYDVVKVEKGAQAQDAARSSVGVDDPTVRSGAEKAVSLDWKTQPDGSREAKWGNAVLVFEKGKLLIHVPDGNPDVEVKLNGEKKTITSGDFLPLEKGAKIEKDGVAYKLEEGDPPRLLEDEESAKAKAPTPTVPEPAPQVADTQKGAPLTEAEKAGLQWRDNLLQGYEQMLSQYGEDLGKRLGLGTLKVRTTPGKLIEDGRRMVKYELITPGENPEVILTLDRVFDSQNRGVDLYNIVVNEKYRGKDIGKEVFGQREVELMKKNGVNFVRAHFQSKIAEGIFIEGYGKENIDNRVDHMVAWPNGKVEGLNPSWDLSGVENVRYNLEPYPVRAARYLLDHGTTLDGKPVSSDLQAKAEAYLNGYLNAMERRTDPPQDTSFLNEFQYAASIKGKGKFSVSSEKSPGSEEMVVLFVNDEKKIAELETPKGVKPYRKIEVRLGENNPFRMGDKVYLKSVPPESGVLFSTTGLKPKNQAEVETWLKGRDLKDLSLAEQRDLITHLTKDKQWKRAELQGLIGPEGMRSFLGYGTEIPFGFESKKQWVEFQKNLMKELFASGIPIDDPRVKIVIQGSAVTGRSQEGGAPYRWKGDPTAKKGASDIDVAIMVDGELFQSFLIKREEGLQAKGKDPKDGLPRVTDEGRIPSEEIPSLKTGRQKVMDHFKARPVQISILDPNSKFVPKPEESMVISADVYAEAAAGDHDTSVRPKGKDQATDQEVGRAGAGVDDSLGTKGDQDSDLKGQEPQTPADKVEDGAPTRDAARSSVGVDDATVRPTGADKPTVPPSPEPALEWQPNAQGHLTARLGDLDLMAVDGDLTVKSSTKEPLFINGVKQPEGIWPAVSEGDTVSVGGTHYVRRMGKLEPFEPSNKVVKKIAGRNATLYFHEDGTVTKTGKVKTIIKDGESKTIDPTPAIDREQRALAYVQWLATKEPLLQDFAPALIGRKSRHELIIGEVKGTRLEDISVEDRQKIPQEAWDNFEAALKVLAAEGIYHGDLTPQNILYDKDAKKLRLVDFGDAKFEVKNNDDLTRAQEIRKISNSDDPNFHFKDHPAVERGKAIPEVPFEAGGEISPAGAQAKSELIADQSPLSLDEAKGLHKEVDYLVGTKTPFTEMAKKYQEQLKGVAEGSPEYTKILENYRAERDELATHIVLEHDPALSHFLGNSEHPGFLWNLAHDPVAWDPVLQRYNWIHRPEGIELIPPHGRLKSPLDVVSKMMRRGWKTLGPFTDMAATRVVVDNYKDVTPVVAAVIDRYPIREVRDANGEILKDDNGKPIRDWNKFKRLIAGDPQWGYRAIHLAVEYPLPNGKTVPVEVQIMTHATYEWGEIQHDLAYKSKLPPEIFKASNDYFVEVAQYLADLDQGVTQPQKPTPPDITSVQGYADLPSDTKTMIQKAYTEMEALMLKYKNKAQAQAEADAEVVSLDSKRKKKDTPSAKQNDETYAEAAQGDQDTTVRTKGKDQATDQEAGRAGTGVDDSLRTKGKNEPDKKVEKTEETEPTRPPDKQDPTPSTADLKDREAQVPIDSSQVMKDANDLAKKYSLGKSQKDWATPRHQLQFFSTPEMAGTPLGEKAAAAKKSAEKILTLRRDIERLINKKAELGPQSPDEGRIDQQIQTKQAELLKEIQTLSAWDQAFAHASAVRDAALSGYVILQENVLVPLEGVVTGSQAQGVDVMSGVKDQVVTVEMDHPDRVENFAEYEKGEAAQAGSLTIVVRDEASVPKVREAAEKGMAADQPAAYKRSIERASAHLVREKVMARQKELIAQRKEGDPNTTVDIKSLWNNFDRVSNEVLSKLKENPTPEEVEKAVGEIAQKTVEGAKIGVVELSGHPDEESKKFRATGDANLQITPDDVKNHVPEAIPPKQVAKGDDRLVFSTTGPDGQPIFMEVRVRVATDKELAQGPPKEPPSVSGGPEGGPGPGDVTWQTVKGARRMGTSPDLPGIVFMDNAGPSRVSQGIELPDGTHIKPGTELKAGTTIPAGTIFHGALTYTEKGPSEIAGEKDWKQIKAGSVLQEDLTLKRDTVYHGSLPGSAEFSIQATKGKHHLVIDGEEVPMNHKVPIPIDDGSRVVIDGVAFDYNQGILTRDTETSTQTSPAVRDSVREYLRSGTMSVEDLIDTFGRKAVDEVLQEKQGAKGQKRKSDFVLEETTEFVSPPEPRRVELNAPLVRGADGKIIPPLIPESALVIGRKAEEQYFDHGGVVGATYKGEGYKNHNEDRLLITKNFVMVLDAMGGHAGGERAGEIARVIAEWADKNGVKDPKEILELIDKAIIQDNQRTNLADAEGRPEPRAPGVVGVIYTIDPNPDGTYRLRAARVGDAALRVDHPTANPDGTVNFDMVHFFSRFNTPEVEWDNRMNPDPGQALGGHYHDTFDPATKTWSRQLDVEVLDVNVQAGDRVSAFSDAVTNTHRMTKDPKLVDEYSRALSAAADHSPQGENKAVLLDILVRQNLLAEAKKSYGKESHWEITQERYEAAYRKAYSHVNGKAPTEIPPADYVSDPKGGKVVKIDLNLEAFGEVVQFGHVKGRKGLHPQGVITHFKNDNVTITVQEVGKPVHFEDDNAQTAPDQPVVFGDEPTAPSSVAPTENQRGPAVDEPTLDMPLAPDTAYGTKDAEPTKEAAMGDKETTAHPQGAGPVEGIVGHEVIAKIVPQGVKADIEIKTQSPDEVVKAVQAQNKSGKIKPHDYVTVHIETDKGYNFVIVDTYQNLTNLNFVAPRMFGRNRGAALQINYIFEKNPNTGETSVHLDFIGVNTSKSGDKGIGKEIFQNWVSYVAKTHPEVTQVTAQAANIRVVSFFAKYLEGAKSVSISQGDRFEHPIDYPITKDFIHNLVKVGALTKGQGEGLIEAKDKNTLDRFQLHDQLFGYLEHNRKEAVENGKSAATTDVEFLIEHIDKNRKLFSGTDTWGDLWIEGNIPGRGQDAAMVDRETTARLGPKVVLASSRIKVGDERIRFAKTLIAEYEVENTKPGETYSRDKDSPAVKSARSYVEAVEKGETPPQDVSFLNEYGHYTVETKFAGFHPGGIVVFGDQPGEAPRAGFGGTVKEVREGVIVIEGAKRRNHRGDVISMGEVRIPVGSDHPPFQKGDWVEFIPPVAGGSGEPPRRRVTQERAALPPPPVALVPTHFYDVKKLDLSSGSQILESKDPQNPWKVKVEYVRGDDNQPAVKLTPLGGEVEIKGPGDADFGPVDPNKTYSLNDDPHLRLGGAEHYFGPMPNAFAGQGYIPLEGYIDGGIAYYGKGTQRADVERLAALDQLPPTDSNALKNPDEPGISTDEKAKREEAIRWNQAAKEFKTKYDALKGKYDLYLEAVKNYEKKIDSGPEATKKREALWQEVMTDFVALTGTDYYKMESKYEEVVKKVAGDLQPLDLVLVDEETQAATKAKKDNQERPDFSYGHFQFLSPDQIGTEKTESILAHPQMVRGLVSIDLQAKDWGTVEQILTRIHGEEAVKILPRKDATSKTPIPDRWLEMGPDGKTATAKVRVTSGDYHYEVEIHISVKEAKEAAPSKEAAPPKVAKEAALDDRDTAVRPSGKIKAQVPDKNVSANDLPDIQGRIAKTDTPLAEGEGLKLIEEIKNSSGEPEEKLKAYLALAQRADFKDFAALMRAIEKSGADPKEVKKAQGEVDEIVKNRAAQGKKKAPAPQEEKKVTPLEPTPTPAPVEPPPKFPPHPVVIKTKKGPLHADLRPATDRPAPKGLEDWRGWMVEKVEGDKITLKTSKGHTTTIKEDPQNPFPEALKKPGTKVEVIIPDPRPPKSFHYTGDKGKGLGVVQAPDRASGQGLTQWQGWEVVRADSHKNEVELLGPALPDSDVRRRMILKGSVEHPLPDFLMIAHVKVDLIPPVAGGNDERIPSPLRSNLQTSRTIAYEEYGERKVVSVEYDGKKYSYAQDSTREGSPWFVTVEDRQGNFLDTYGIKDSSDIQFLEGLFQSDFPSDLKRDLSTKGTIKYEDYGEKKVLSVEYGGKKYSFSRESREYAEWSMTTYDSEGKYLDTVDVREPKDVEFLTQLFKASEDPLWGTPAYRGENSPMNSPFSALGDLIDSQGITTESAILVPHQPGAKGYGVTDYVQLTVVAPVDFVNGEVLLERPNGESLTFKFKPENPPEFVKSLKPGMELDILHGGGGSAWKGEWFGKAKPEKILEQAADVKVPEADRKTAQEKLIQMAQEHPERFQGPLLDQLLHRGTQGEIWIAKVIEPLLRAEAANPQGPQVVTTKLHQGVTIRDYRVQNHAFHFLLQMKGPEATRLLKIGFEKALEYRAEIQGKSGQGQGPYRQESHELGERTRIIRQMRSSYNLRALRTFPQPVLTLYGDHVSYVAWVHRNTGLIDRLENQAPPRQSHMFQVEFEVGQQDGVIKKVCLSEAGIHRAPFDALVGEKVSKGTGEVISPPQAGSPAPAPAPKNEIPAPLVIQPQAGQTEITIGRAHQPEIKSEVVSRHHATLEFKDGKWKVFDGDGKKASTHGLYMGHLGPNGEYVNDHRVMNPQGRELPDGAVLATYDSNTKKFVTIFQFKAPAQEKIAEAPPAPPQPKGVLIAAMAPGEPVIFGRGPDGQGRKHLGSREVSKNHVKVEYGEKEVVENGVKKVIKGVYVTSLVSPQDHFGLHSYGVYVHGEKGWSAEPIKPGEKVFVPAGKEVGLGIIHPHKEGKAATKDAVVIVSDAEGKIYTESELVDQKAPPKAPVDIAPYQGHDTQVDVVPISVGDVYGQDAARQAGNDEALRPWMNPTESPPPTPPQVLAPPIPGVNRQGQPEGLVFGGRSSMGTATLIPRDGTVVDGPNDMKFWFNQASGQYEYWTEGSPRKPLQVGQKVIATKPTVNGKGVIEDPMVFVELQGARPVFRPEEMMLPAEDLETQVNYQLAAAEIPYHLWELQRIGAPVTGVDENNLKSLFNPNFDKALSSYDAGDPTRTQGGLFGGETHVFAMVDPQTGAIFDFCTRDGQRGGKRGQRWEVDWNPHHGRYEWKERSGKWGEAVQGIPSGAVVVPITVERMTGKILVDPVHTARLGLSSQAFQRMTNLNGFVARVGGSAYIRFNQYIHQTGVIEMP